MFWNWSWPTRILSVVVLGVIFAILYPVFDRARENHGPRGRSCQSNLKQLGLAFVQYEQDYNENFPPIITGGSAYGWADALQPYLKSTSMYQCPSDPDRGQTTPLPMQNGYIDYPFNANLDRQASGTMLNLAQQIVLLDGNDGLEVTNARYCLTQIPLKWFDDEKSPLHRHLDTANFLFADGHVKSMKPAQLSTDKHLVF